MKTVKVIAALALIVLLGVFGIANIGGDTWVTAGTPLPPGWMRNPSPVTPQPPPSIALPGILILALVVIAIFDVVVRSPMSPIEEEKDPNDVPGTTQT